MFVMYQFCQQGWFLKRKVDLKSFILHCRRLIWGLVNRCSITDKREREMDG